MQITNQVLRFAHNEGGATTWKKTNKHISNIFQIHFNTLEYICSKKRTIRLINGKVLSQVLVKCSTNVYIFIQPVTSDRIIWWLKIDSSKIQSACKPVAKKIKSIAG